MYIQKAHCPRTTVESKYSRERAVVVNSTMQPVDTFTLLGILNLNKYLISAKKAFSLFCFARLQYCGIIVGTLQLS